MAESEQACPECDAPRQCAGRCRCGSFAAPASPKPIRVPDPALAVASWGAIPSKAGNRAGGVLEYQRPQPPAFESKVHPSARCGRTFETMPERRMLCAGCYKGAGGGLDL